MEAAYPYPSLISSQFSEYNGIIKILTFPAGSDSVGNGLEADWAARQLEYAHDARNPEDLHDAPHLADTPVLLLEFVFIFILEKPDL